MKCKPVNTCSNGCPLELPGDCVFYSGPDTSFLEIPTGSSLNDIIVGIDDYLSTLQDQIDAFDYQDLEYNPETGALSITHGNFVLLPIPVNADWNSTSGLSEILNKPTFSEVAFTGDYNDLINVPPVIVPNLQSVTNQGNFTDNAIVVTGSNNSNQGDGLYLNHDSTGSSVFSGDPNGVIRGMLSIEDTLVELGSLTELQLTSSGGSTTISSVDNIILEADNGISFNSTSGVPSTFSGRVKGLPATESDDFVTLSQISSFGTVSSVGISSTDLVVLGSPITTSGVINLNIGNNAVTYAKIQDITASRILGRYSATGGDAQEIQVGSGLNLNASTGILTATGSGGTVTSVGLTMPSVFSVASSPITTAGTLGVTFAGGQVANQVLASPNGSAGAVALRYLVANDIPNLDTGKLTTGILPIARGGTNTGTIGTAGQLARVNSGATAIEYFTPTYISGNQTITLSGDVTGSGATSIATTIANDVVTFAKIQNITASRLLGRYTASTGDTQEIQVGTGLALNTSTGILTNSSPDQTVSLIGASGVSITGTYPNFTITGPGTTGSFILNGISPQTASFNVTGTGTIGNGLTVSNGTTVITGDITFATTPSGGITFNFDAGNSTGDMFYRSAAGRLERVSPGANGEVLTLVGGLPSWEPGGSSGTVTSVGLTSSDITVGGTSPITSSGTYTLTLPNINGNVGTFNNLTVNAKGQVTAASNVSYLTTETDPVVSARTLTLIQGSGITVTNSGVGQSLATSRSWTITNSAPDQTVVLNDGTGIAVSGTYPNFTISNTAPDVPQDLDSVLTEGNTSSLGAVMSYLTTGAVNSGGPGALVLGTNNNNIITVSSGGTVSIAENVGINQTAGSESLEVTGNGTFTGTITATGGGFNSARGLKENIREFSDSAIDIISRIPVKQFKYKNGSNNTIGFIADEVPRQVLVDDKEAVDIYSVLGILVKGIQELNNKINGLGIASE